MQETAPLFVAILAAAGGMVAAVRAVRWLYLHPIDSWQGALFDRLMSPLVRKGEEAPPADGDITVQSGPRPRWRF